MSIRIARGFLWIMPWILCLLTVVPRAMATPVEVKLSGTASETFLRALEDRLSQVLTAWNGGELE
ncbi:hypothetical protein KJ815_07640, partial [bacterium]|nr:hypothetical protein [bacterium]